MKKTDFVLKKKQASARSSRSGFTLIELLVVISIIGILAGLLLANFVNVRERAADAKRKNDVNQMKKALRLYYNDNQNYPDQGTGNSIEGCGADGDQACGTNFTAGSTVYMKDLPVATEYDYYSSGSETFLLVTTLANASDEDATTSQARCSAEVSEYSVTLDTADYVVCQD